MPDEHVVHCQYCQAELNKEEAYLVGHDDRLSYYCDPEHFRLWRTNRPKAIQLARDIVGTTPTKELNKGLDDIAKTVGWEMLIEYLQSEGDRISNRLINRSFTYANSKVRYFITWITNDIMEFVDIGKKVKFHVDPIRQFSAKTKRKPKQGMDNLIEDILKNKGG